MIRNDIQVFISSAMDELAFEREIAQEVVEQFRLEPSLFELLPAMSDSPDAAQREMVESCDIYVMILHREHSRPTFDEYEVAVSENKPIIALVRRTEKERAAGVDKFLEALRGRVDHARAVRTVYKEYSTLGEFRAALRDSLAGEMRRLFRSPSHTLTREEMYKLGARIIHAAQRRVAIVERTPSLFFGARPYEAREDRKWTHERQLLDALKAWIEAARERSERQLIYAYSPRDAREHLAEQTKNTRAAMVERLRDTVPLYKGIERETNLRLRFRPLSTVFSGPMAVGDNRVAFWLLGENNAVSIQQENHAIASDVVRMLSLYTGHDVDADHMIREIIGTL